VSARQASRLTGAKEIVPDPAPPAPSGFQRAASIYAWRGVTGRRAPALHPEDLTRCLVEVRAQELLVGAQRSPEFPQAADLRRRHGFSRVPSPLLNEVVDQLAPGLLDGRQQETRARASPMSSTPPSLQR